MLMRNRWMAVSAAMRTLMGDVEVPMPMYCVGQVLHGPRWERRSVRGALSLYRGTGCGTGRDGASTRWSSQPRYGRSGRWGRLSGFTNVEETQAGLADKAVWLLQDRLVELGADFQEGAPWQVNVVVDRNLVTGQNPMSSEPLAIELLKKLS